MAFKNFLIPVVSALVAQAALLAHAGDDPDGFREISNGGQELAAILESLPYTSEGSGPVMYTFEFSECPYSQAKYRDTNGARNIGLEMRRLLAPVGERAGREAAALGKSRDIRDYHAFMTGRKRAPAFDRDNTAIDAYNAIGSAAIQDIPAILHQNVWTARGFVYPQYFWIEDGKVFANGGYLKDNFANAVARARKGGGTAEVWQQVAGGREHASAPAAASLDASPLEGRDVAGLDHGSAQEAPVAMHDRFDVLDIRLGDHLDNVIPKFRERFPPAFIQRTTDDLGRIRGSLLQGLSYFDGVTGSERRRSQRPQRGSANDALEVRALAPPNDPLVVALSRIVSLEQPMLASRMRELLEDKYGPMLGEFRDLPRRGQQVWSWARDTEGRPLDAPGVRACVHGQRQPQWIRNRPDNLGQAPQCGFVFAVSLSEQEYIDGYDTLLYDANMIRSGNARSVAYSRAEAEKIAAARAREEREAADRAARPPL